MQKDFFGGIINSLSGFIPKDDSDGQLFLAEKELSELKARETEIYAEIGRISYAKIPDDEDFKDYDDEINLINKKHIRIKEQIEELKREKQEKEKAKAAAQALRCPECGEELSFGSKFCVNCGSKVKVSDIIFCSECGNENKEGTRFCGECGTKLLIDE